MTGTEQQGEKSSATHCAAWVLPSLLAFSVLLLCLPTPGGMTPAAHRLLSIAVLMASLWVTQAIPLAATSLLPLALFPLFGIQTADETSKAFVEDVLFLYIGGMILALGIERWNLHRRIALNIVSLVGVSPRKLVLGFGVATFALSMWISNTACTMLMLPIGLAMLKILDDHDGDSIDSAAGIRRSGPLAVPLLLILAYASSLGGMTTLVGSPTNSVAVGLYRSELPPDAPNVYFSHWFLCCLPISLIYFGIVWYVLVRKLPSASPSDQDLAAALRERLSSLGPMSKPEFRMLILFSVAAVLWVTREPMELGKLKLFAGWYSLYADLFVVLSDYLGAPSAAWQIFVGNGKAIISDATVAIAMASLLFILPSGTRDARHRNIPLMDWRTAHRLPWDMILLFGGGFALASGFKATQLDKWLGAAMQSPLQNVPGWLVVAILCLALIMLTELTSNVATVNAVIPTVLALAGSLDMDPRLLFVPATLACSCGFMLPVGTPPNAIVFSTGRIPAREMVIQGLWLNLIGVPILTAGTYLFIRPIMGIQNH